MPATSLKIDQSFVRAIGASRHDAAIVRAMAHLAHDLGFRVVAEGVETHAIYQAVVGMACHEAQGYYISPPLRADAVPGWLAQHRATLPLRDVAAARAPVVARARHPGASDSRIDARALSHMAHDAGDEAIAPRQRNPAMLRRA